MLTTDPNWSQTLRFKIKQGIEPLPAFKLSDLGESNMGSPKALGDFVKWALKTYPAKRTMLVIWDHGDGYRFMNATLQSLANTELKQEMLLNDSTFIKRLRENSNLQEFRSTSGAPFRSCSNDETNDDKLYNREIQDVLLKELKGKKLDILGFDCCLMAMLETGYAFKETAQFMVASQDLEPGEGWDYEDWLSRLLSNPQIDAQSLSREVVSSYEKVTSTDDPTTTLSAVDLGKIQNASTAISSLSSLLIENISTEAETIKACRKLCKNFAPKYTRPNPFYHIDIIRFCDLLSQQSKNELVKNAARQAYNDLIKSVSANYKGSSRGGEFGGNGIAIYFPPTGRDYKNDQYAEKGYEKNNKLHPVAFVQSEKWADFLYEYYTMVK